MRSSTRLRSLSQLQTKWTLSQSTKLTKLLKGNLKEMRARNPSEGIISHRYKIAPGTQNSCDNTNNLNQDATRVSNAN